MDAKGLLMKTRRMEIFTQKSADAVVKAILGETPVSSYISGKEIDSCKEEEVPLRSHMMSRLRSRDLNSLSCREKHIFARNRK